MYVLVQRLFNFEPNHTKVDLLRRVCPLVTQSGHQVTSDRVHLKPMSKGQVSRATTK